MTYITHLTLTLIILTALSAVAMHTAYKIGYKTAELQLIDYHPVQRRD